MLQQTRVETVLTYFLAFIKKFPDIQSLAKANLEDVLKSWELMGYYARARNLHRAAQLLMEKYQAELPQSYADLKSLPGVGEYIAAAVSSIAFGLPYPVIDGNVKRVLARIFKIASPLNSSQFLMECKNKLSEIFNRNQPGEFNQSIMELGATLCKPRNPDCGICPVQVYCGAYINQAQQKFPLKAAKKKVPEYHIALGVILDNHKLLITQRKPSGLLGGLWELPGGKVNPGETPQQACAREIKEEVHLEVTVQDYLTRIKHAYTHFKIVVDVFRCEVSAGTINLNGPIDYRWISSSEISRYTFPAANHKIFHSLRSKLDYFESYQMD
jgi:A/G-specific adenine glycosylase